MDLLCCFNRSNIEQALLSQLKQQMPELSFRHFVYLYSRRDLNPHGHNWPLDFKSNVSTNSTTRATILERKTVSMLRENPRLLYLHKVFRFIERKTVPMLRENPRLLYLHKVFRFIERKTGFEPATLTLAR